MNVFKLLVKVYAKVKMMKKVTMAKYFTPNGNYIHKKGIEPDINLEYNYTGDSNQPYDMMKDNQVQKAIEVLKQK